MRVNKSEKGLFGTFLNVTNKKQTLKGPSNVSSNQYGKVYLKNEREALVFFRNL